MSQARIQVRYPGNVAYGYDPPLDEIVAMESCHRSIHAGHIEEGTWILMADGEAFPLTKNYFSSIKKIHRGPPGGPSGHFLPSGGQTLENATGGPEAPGK